MGISRNTLRELAGAIHDMMYEAESHRCGGTDAPGLIERRISIQFILLSSASYLRSFEGAHPAAEGDGSVRDMISVMTSRFPGIFGAFSGIVPENPCGEKVSRMLTEAMDKAAGEGDPRILGWLYQFFTSAEHGRAVDALKRKKITREEVPAATQLFTPEWVTEYLVDNSLGILWTSRHPESPLAESLGFLVKERIPSGTERPGEEEVPTVFDPCVGSGNFLICAFDVLIKILSECGVPEKEAVSRILSGSLFGCDIDDRVVAIARFCLMMKAALYDPSLGDEAVCRNVIVIKSPDEEAAALAEEVCRAEPEAGESLGRLMDICRNAGEYGSLTVTDGAGPELLDECERIVSGKLEKGVPGAAALSHLIRQTRMLSERYDAVLTNPPYLSRYTGELKEYVGKHYPRYKKDLFGAFVYRCCQMTKAGGYCAMMTPMVWMFIRSFEALRRFVTEEMSILTLTQMEYSAFDDATVPLCAFVLASDASLGDGTYFRLTDFPGGMEVQKAKLLEAVQDGESSYRYTADKSLFSRLPGCPIAYWASRRMIRAFERGIPLGDIASPKQGLATTDNDRYLRLWHEVEFPSIGFGMNDTAQAADSSCRWFPYNKGGDFRKWYGNDDYVVDYGNDGESIRRSVMEKYPYLKSPGYVVKNTGFYFRPSASWSLISSSDTAFRYKPPGYIFDVAGMSLFSENDLLFLLALCNTKTAREILRIIAPTINFQCGDIARIPVIFPDEETKERICALSEENIELCREDWDSFETSWDFKKHPLV